ncbi:Na+/H+ antiporter [Microlunatus flavus]|uniref:Monovalent cation:H+ antiporter, CPA1 family n=1 Tax=Microlunatus flavus TaxID=1036181 RepID=A0A1H9GEY1_9ACTN|nr:Na+/H+ antiporter [Microlunatus flavus]SEQ48651.1 monovalent cation:H+ antiporter, CPA1 family [Microlunatus flavus]
MLGLEMVVVLGVALLLGGLLAGRFPIAPALVLVLAGVLIGFVPELGEVQLPPEVVLLLFLPALLYWESLTTSLREIRSNLRVVVLASTGLVVATAGSVATVAHLLGMPWGPAWVLGGAIAPTDATAVGVLARALPRRTVTVLRAESLVNDGTALVIYGLAVGVTVGTEHLTPLHVSWLLVLSYVGGALAGVLVGLVAWQLRRRLDDPMLENIAILVTPFAAFLLAESIHASGVLAVVVCGLLMSQLAPRVTGAVTRQTTTAFWSVSTTVLSSVLFVLVGQEAHAAVRNLPASAFGTAVGFVLAVTAVVIATRWAWLYTTPYLIRLLDRRPSQRLRRVSARARTVNATTGFRGAVSLAAALAIPHQLSDGSPFPGRDLIIVITSGVIVLTLLQALALPAVVRFARLAPDSSVAEERHLAEVRTTDAAYDAVTETAAELGTDQPVVDRVRHEIDKQRKLLAADGAAEDPVVQYDDQYTALRLALVARKRSALLELRDDRSIDDIVLRQVLDRIDLEEVRLLRAAPAE